MSPLLQTAVKSAQSTKNYPGRTHTEITYKNQWINSPLRLLLVITHYIYCLLFAEVFAFPDKMELDCREPQSHHNCAQRILDCIVSEGELQCFCMSLLDTQHPVLRRTTFSLRRASMFMLKGLLKMCVFQHQELLWEYFSTVKVL